MTPQEKSQIKGMLTSPQWKAVEHIIETMRAEIKEDSCIRVNEFETLKTLFYNEGKRDGLKDLVQRLYNEAS
jgi:hypothetical protein